METETEVTATEPVAESVESTQTTYEKPSDEKRKEIVAAVDALRSTGESARQACKTVGVDQGRYFYYKAIEQGRIKKSKSAPKHRERFSKEERTTILRSYQNRGDESAKAFARRHGVNVLTLFGWVRRHEQAPMEEAREIVQVPANGTSAELKVLKIENSRLKVIVADLMLDKQALMEFNGRR